MNKFGKKTRIAAKLGQLSKLAASIKAASHRQKRFQLEGVEPRILLSATPIALTSGTTGVSVDIDGSDIRLVDQDGNEIAGSRQTYSTFQGYTINGTSSDDTVTVEFDDNLQAADTWTLTFNGGAGNDTFVFDDTVDLGGVDLVVNAETIRFDSSADVTTTGDITLTAEDHAATVSDTSSSATITIDSAASLTADNFVASATSYFDGGESAGERVALAHTFTANDNTTRSNSARVNLNGDLTLTGDATISATTHTELSFTLAQYDIDFDYDNTAGVIIGKEADVIAASLDVDASATGDITVSGSIGSQFNQTGDELVETRIDKGALVGINNSGSYDATERMSLTAQNTLDVTATLAGAALTTDPFETKIRLDNTQTTRSLLGFADTSNTETARTIAVKGAAAISALNGGDYISTVNSPIFGLVINEREITTGADVSNVTMVTGTLSVEATDEGQFTADARFAQNLLSGSTLATASDATITAFAADTDSQAITFKAIDDTELGAHYVSEISGSFDSATLSSLVPLNADGVMVLNQNTRSIKADVIETNLTASGANRDVDIVAQRTGAMDATANVTVASSGFTLGGIIAENRLGYDAGAIDTLSGVANLISSAFLTPTAPADSADIRALLNADTETLSISGELNIKAEDAVQVNSTVSNVASTENSASWVNDGVGFAASFTLTQNLLDVDIIARAENYDAGTVGDGLAIEAKDDVNLYSNVLLTSESVIGNDGGVSVLAADIQGLLADATTDTMGSSFDFGDEVFVMRDYTHGGEAGITYQFVGADATALTNPDFSDLDYWKPLTASSIVSMVPNFQETDGAAVGAAFVKNEMDSSVTANLANITLTNTDSVKVEAIGDGDLYSTLDVNVNNTSGSDITGNGDSFAFGGFISTNHMRGAVDAKINDASITISNTDSDTTNSNVTVDAQQSRGLYATNNNLITTTNTAVGAVVAFNIVGYDVTNFLSLGVQNLIGTDAAMTQEDAFAKAGIIDSLITGAGLNDVSVLATNSLITHAITTNDTASNASAMFAATEGTAFGFGFVSNIISSSVEAQIQSDGASDAVNATGMLVVEAKTPQKLSPIPYYHKSLARPAMMLAYR